MLLPVPVRPMMAIMTSALERINELKFRLLRGGLEKGASLDIGLTGCLYCDIDLRPSLRVEPGIGAVDRGIQFRSDLSIVLHSGSVRVRLGLWAAEGGCLRLLIFAWWLAAVPPREALLQE